MAELDLKQILRLFLKKYIYIVVGIKFKEYITSFCIFGIIVYKFNYYSELDWMVLFLNNKIAKVYIYYIILSLYLAI